MPVQDIDATVIAEFKLKVLEIRNSKAKPVAEYQKGKDVRGQT